MKVTDIKSNELDQYYQRYFAKVAPEYELLTAFATGQQHVFNFFQDIPEDKLTYRYAEGKWTPLEVLQHLIDTERIFMYRCFRIARRDTTPLAGFDQDVYIDPSLANQKTLDQLLEEFTATRNASISLLKSLTEEDLCFIGDANGGAMSARAAAFLIPGHEVWHMEVIKERYLNV